MVLGKLDGFGCSKCSFMYVEKDADNESLTLKNLENINLNKKSKKSKKCCGCYNQGGLNKKEVQLNLCNTFSILIFNEFYLLNS